MLLCFDFKAVSHQQTHGLSYFVTKTEAFPLLAVLAEKLLVAVQAVVLELSVATQVAAHLLECLCSGVRYAK